MSDIEPLLDALQVDPDEEFVIERDGKPAAVLISIERSGRLDALRHIEPVEPAAGRCKDTGPRTGALGWPLCSLDTGHAGPHRAHESWGEVTW
jgi:antitoxin (DNA-binding transcriptional repressor) of toxin-antitoxin stability system